MPHRTHVSGAQCHMPSINATQCRWPMASVRVNATQKSRERYVPSVTCPVAATGQKGGCRRCHPNCRRPRARAHTHTHTLAPRRTASHYADRALAPTPNPPTHPRARTHTPVGPDFTCFPQDCGRRRRERGAGRGGTRGSWPRTLASISRASPWLSDFHILLSFFLECLPSLLVGIMSNRCRRCAVAPSVHLIHCFLL
jgi:hypothetical protein